MVNWPLFTLNFLKRSSDFDEQDNKKNEDGINDHSQIEEFSKVDNETKDQTIRSKDKLISNASINGVLVPSSQIHDNSRRIEVTFLED